MGIADFQRALADMTLDSRFAATVRRHGVAALGDYELTPLESHRLESIAGQKGMSLCCTLARANRFGPINDAFPMTCVLLEPQLRAILDDLWSRHRPDNYQLAGEETAFAACLDDLVSRQQLSVEYLDEVFAYEKACWSIASEFRFRARSDAGGVPRRVTFRHDPGILLSCLGRFESPPPGLPEGRYEVTVAECDGELTVEWDQATL